LTTWKAAQCLRSKKPCWILTGPLRTFLCQKAYRKIYMSILGWPRTAPSL